MSSGDAGEITARWLPQAQFKERHGAVVTGSAETILATLKSFDVSQDKVMRFMMDLREAPSRIWAKLGGHSAIAGCARFGLDNFTLLGESPHALVYGMAGRFWQLDYGLEHLDSPDAFKHFNMPGVSRLVMAYSAIARADGLIDLVTETRVYCPDQKSLNRFRPYWIAIRLGSGFIRRRILARASR
ncbi:hypothetical protein [Aestuariivirga litoralis]|uniref:hypothetical protein n=1 Tax=Aestuariivirga litoralis TaxID=2650924 RepID=UPI0018C57AAC|nr:hypothetical protein [Aestuariivirga litoralis]MBG1233762.1 hypothetical protein [Aestuariivirga litoralis]